MTSDLKVFVRDEKVYTSFTASLLPAVIPRLPPWDPREDYDRSPDDSETPLTTLWAYRTRPWFPLVPLNPEFNGPIFNCLNHSKFSLRTEADGRGKYMLHSEIREKWHDLEQKLLWCLDRLGAGLLVPWSTILPSAPTSYGYQRSHVDAKLAIKVALRSRNAFLLIAAVCTWHIMSRRYRGSNRPWTSTLTDDPTCPIPDEWVLELSRSFVGDLSTNVQRTGVFISSIHCPWEGQLPMFEHFSIPIWVYCVGNDSVIDSKLSRYIPSGKAITQAITAQQWGQMPDDSAWGQPSQPDNGSQSALGWEETWGQDVGWGLDSGEQQPVSNAPHEPTVSGFPVPERGSGQKPGEDWKAFFARRHEENKKREETETPVRRQSRLSREQSAKNHSIPSRSSTVVVFEWQPQDGFDGFLLRIRIKKAEILNVWGSYNKSTRTYDSFRHEWDLCSALDPTSIPDGDWEEDDFPDIPPPPRSPLPLPLPPSRSSFLRDIHNYFGHYEVASSNHASGIEQFVSILHFHFGYQLAASTSTPRSRSSTFDDWIYKTKWIHLCKLVGDTGDVAAIPDVQKHVITCFIGYLVTLPESQLPDMPPDLWDLGPDTSLSASNAYIRVSYMQLPQQRFYVIEPSTSPNLLLWKLVIPDATTAVMCLRRDWGSDIVKIAFNLLRRGIAFKTLQPMGVAPHARRPLTELRMYSLGYKPPSFTAVYADYIMYEQHRHEFMNQPRARAAFLHGGLIWRLALHSFGFNDLPSVLDGLSREAVPFGLMLPINGQTYFDDELSEVEQDFICGTYYVYTNDGTAETTSWWPRPHTWAASGLNVGFWSDRCEHWFQTRLNNIRQGVSRSRHSSAGDVNGPMTGTQWKRSLKFNPSTNKMMKNVDAGCYDFLATKASVFTEN